MADFHEEFIAEMQKKYHQFTRPGNFNTGLGGNGRLDKSAPAGVVHEGEQVVEADMVDEAGGPRRIRAAIENLANENEQMPVEEGPPAAPPGRLRGYQAGTGEDVVKLPDAPAPVTTHESFVKLPETPDPITTTTTRNRFGTWVDEGGQPVGEGPGQININKPAEDFKFNVPKDDGEVETFTDREDLYAARPEFQPAGTPPPADAEPPPTGDDGADDDGVGTALTEAGELGTDVLKDVITGGSEVSRTAALRAQQQLSKKHEAERQSLNQSMAQAGESKEAIRAAHARLGAQQRSESEGVKSDLAAAEAQRAETAALEAAKLGLGAEQFESKLALEEQMVKVSEAGQDLSRDQFDVWSDIQYGTLGLSESEMGLKWEQFKSWEDQLGVENAFKAADMDLRWEHLGLSQDQMDLNWSNFYENQRQFGVTTAMQMAELDLRSNSWVVNTAMAAGDFETVQDVMDTYGFDIDISAIEDAQDRALVGDGLANLALDVQGSTADTAGMLDDQLIQSDLADIWNGMNGTDDNYDKLSENAAFNTWAEQKVDDMRVMNSPFGAIAWGMENEDVDALAESAGVDVNATDYDRDKFRRQYASMFFGGGLTMNEDGNLTYDSEFLDGIAGEGEEGTSGPPLTPGGDVDTSFATGIMAQFDADIAEAGERTITKDGKTVTSTAPVTDAERDAAINTAKESLLRLSANEATAILDDPTLLKKYEDAGIIREDAPEFTMQGVLYQDDWDAQGFNEGDIVVMSVDGIPSLVVIGERKTEEKDSVLNKNKVLERKSSITGRNLAAGDRSETVIYTTGWIDV